MEQIIEKMNEAWETFINDGTILPCVRPYVADAWRLSKANNLDPYSKGSAKKITHHELQKCIKENIDLVSIADPALTRFREELPFIDLITFIDKNGVILKNYATPEMIKFYRETFNIEVGVTWSIASDNLYQTLLHDEIVDFIDSEYYLKNHHNFIGITVPVHSSSRNIIGCIGVNLHLSKIHSHKELGLLKANLSMLAYTIERQLEILNASKIREQVFNSVQEGIITTDNSGKIMSMSNSINKIFNISDKAILYKDICDILNDFKNISKNGTYNGELLFNINSKKIRCYGSIAILSLKDCTEGYTLIFNTEQRYNKIINKTVGNRAYYNFDHILTKSSKMLAVLENAKRIANTNCNVLILGDSGTGKEMLAQSIHSASNRSNGPLVIVNCAVLPRNLVESELFGYEKGSFTGASSEGSPGKFELADKGTLFLDEIGELPLEIQPKLLRAIEDHAVSRIGSKSAKPIDVRLICATNRNLAKEIHNKTFRADLFYRINVITLHIPPLNERGDDILYLAAHFINKLNKINDTNKKLSLDFLNRLTQTNWEGNVRQLENTITQAYYLSSPDSNLLAALPDYTYEDEQIPKTSIESTSMQNIERDAIVYALKFNKGKIANVAADLKLGRTTIYRKIKHYKITPDEYL